MDSDGLSHLQGPPRKKVRKGTRSCTECRRRKVRCTYDPDRPSVCNGCNQRGTTCIDQWQESLGSPKSTRHTDQSHSLRERINRLEAIIEGFLNEPDERAPRKASWLLTPEEEPVRAVQPPRGSAHPLTGASPTPEIDTPDEHLGAAPVLQLFDNEYVVRTSDIESKNDKLTGSKDVSPKAHAVRSALLSLLPSRHDLDPIVQSSSMCWSVWENKFPEICDKCRPSLPAGLSDSETPMAPAEVAKLLVFISIIVAQLPFDFDYSSLDVPFDPQEFASRCVSEVDRLIVYDDHFAATLPGIECQMLLSKYRLNEGQPRKAWLINRRAIEFAQLSGLHLSTAKPPRPDDTLFDRRIKIWCQLVCTDRYISLILGLPYAVSDVSFAPQVEMCMRAQGSALDMYMLQLGSMSGKIIDRNQNSEEPCLPTTLRLEQELEDIEKKTPGDWWDADAHHNTKDDRYQERIIMQFTHHTLRLFLHLPFMLKSSTDRRFQYCHTAAVESAQNGLQLYKVLRTGIKPYLCKISDFFAFMMTMLLVIHLVGHSGESTNHSSEEQDDRDWDLIHEVTNILRQAGTENGGTVAAESANILGKLIDCYANEGPSDQIWNNTCKITVPYFGTITVGPGKKLFGKAITAHSRSQSKKNSARHKQQPEQLFTPPLSNLGDPASRSGDTPNTGSIASQASYPVEPWSQMSMPTWPTVDLEVNAFHGLLGVGEDIWPNFEIDLALDQGWNVDWLGGSTLS